MRYVEPHAHMVSRTTDDYQAMLTAGCAAVCEPAFWAGFDRGAPEAFYNYFQQLTIHEPNRAAKLVSLTTPGSASIPRKRKIRCWRRK